MIQTVEELDYHMMYDRVQRTYGRIKRERGELADLDDCFHDTWLDLLERGIPQGLNAITIFMNRFRQINYDRYVRNRSGITYTSDALFENPDDLYGEYVSIDMETPASVNTRAIRNSLTHREWEVYSLMTSSKEYNQRQVALVLGVSPQAITYTLNKLSNKIKGIGLGVLQEHS